MCATYLNTNTKIEDLMIEGFSPTPIRADYQGPSTRPRGGVCLYHKETTTIKHRPDLEIMDETIVAEIKINKKSIIYILSYRSPSQSTSEFNKYIQDLEKTYNKALAENPYMIVLTGDYNARSPLLWQDEQKQTAEGKAMADFCTKNFLQQIIDEPTHILKHVLT